MAPKKDKGKAKAVPEPQPVSSSEEEVTLAEMMRRSRRDVGDPGAGPSTRRYPSRVRRPPPLMPYKRAPLPALDWTTVRPPSPSLAPPPPPRRPQPRLQPRQHEMTTFGQYVMDHPLGVNREDDPEYAHFVDQAFRRLNPREAFLDPTFAFEIPIVPRTQQPRPHHAGASSSSSASASKGKRETQPAASKKKGKGKRKADGGVGKGGYWTQTMQQLCRNQDGLPWATGPPIPEDQFRRIYHSYMHEDNMLYSDDPLVLQGAEPPRRKASASSSSSASASAPQPKKRR